MAGKSATRVAIRYPILYYWAKVGAFLGNEEFYLTGTPVGLFSLSLILLLSFLFCSVPAGVARCAWASSFRHVFVVDGVVVVVVVVDAVVVVVVTVVLFVCVFMFLLFLLFFYTFLSFLVFVLFLFVCMLFL